MSGAADYSRTGEVGGSQAASREGREYVDARAHGLVHSDRGAAGGNPLGTRRRLEGSAEFRSAKTALQQQLRGKNPDGRIAAVKKLAEYPVPDAAKLALGVATKDEASEVRDAAYGTVSALSETPAAAKYLFDTLEKQLKAQTT